VDGVQGVGWDVGFAVLNKLSVPRVGILGLGSKFGMRFDCRVFEHTCLFERKGCLLTFAQPRARN
jgi:hypothetical protein